VPWESTPQRRLRRLVAAAWRASMPQLTAQPHVMPALLASIKILRAKATARCAWRDRGPTRVLLLVRACVLHVRLVHTPMRRPWHRALHVARARSPTAAPVLGRRCAPNASRGSTQRYRAPQRVFYARPARMAQQKAPIRRKIAYCARPANTKKMAGGASARAAPQGASATQVTMRQRRASGAALGSTAAPSRRSARNVVRAC
jgi:hypothetical protein